MIDLLGIFTLWCLHNFDNNRSNNFDENKRVLIQFFCIFAPINKKKYSIETGPLTFILMLKSYGLVVVGGGCT